MKVGICNDHAALDLKNLVVEHLEKQGYEVVNYGTNTPDSFDYPLAATALCRGLQSKEVELGIAICATGVGISIACNKHLGIRACCCSETTSARLTREHNNANVICFGAKIVGAEVAYQIVDTFLTTPFSQGERHIRRVNEITDIENNK